MTTRNVLIQVASLQQEQMTVCRETLSSHRVDGGLIEIWGYEKPDKSTRSKYGGKCRSMKLKDALMDYVQSSVFAWADDDIHGVHPMSYKLEKVRHPVEGTRGFILRIMIWSDME